MKNSPASTCPTRDELERFIAEGAYDGPISRHVENCNSCTQLADQIRRDNELIRDYVVALKGDAQDSKIESDLPTIEGYQIVSEIHRGGQGIVYKAIQTITRRVVAVKTLLPGVFGSTKHRLRFRREVQVVARLSHPNIVTLFDSGTTEDGRLFYTMEFIEGVRLDQFAQKIRRKNKNLSTKESVAPILRLFAKICEAVQYAYQHGIVHRDLKPANVLVDVDGQPHVLDFGLAKALGVDHLQEDFIGTQTGEFLGTLAYAAPEQVRGFAGHVDTRTDVYSLGVMLYELLTRALPSSQSGGLTDVVRSIAEVDPLRPSVRRPGLDDDIDAIVLKALSKERERRYQSPESLRRDIELYLIGLPIDAKRDNTWYVLRRIVRRHKLGVAMVTVILVLLSGFALTMAVLAGKLATERDAVRQTNRQLQLQSARALVKSGDTVQAEDILWRVLLTSPKEDQPNDPPHNLSRPGSLDAYWALWELYAQQPCLRTWVGTSSGFGSIDLSPDSRLLASAGGDGMIKLWTVATGELVDVVDSGDALPGPVRFMPDGVHLVWGTSAGEMTVWNLKASRVEYTFAHSKGRVGSLAVSPADNIVASALYSLTDCAIYVWDFGTGLSRILGETDDSISDLCFSSDGKRLVSVDHWGSTKLWDIPSYGLVESFMPLIRLPANRSDPNYSIQLHPSENKLVLSNGFLLDFESRTKNRLYRHCDSTTALRFTDDGCQLISSYWDRMIKVYDWDSGELALDLAGHRSYVNELAVSSQERLIVSCGADGLVKLWEMDAFRCLQKLVGHANTVHCVAFSRDGRLLASSDGDEAHPTLCIWDALTRKLKHQLAGHSGVISGIAFSPNGDLLVSVGYDRTLRVWDILTGRCVHLLEELHARDINYVAWSPDSVCVATASNDQTVKLWNSETWRLMDELSSEAERMPSACFSGDGKWLAACAPAGPGMVFLYDRTTREKRLLYEGVHGARAVAFSPDSRLLASGHTDGWIRLWEVPSGHMLDAWQAHFHDVFALHFHPEQSLLVSGSRGGEIRLWDVSPSAKDRYLAALVGHDEMVFSVCFSPDGRTLASGSADRTVGMWDLTYYDKHIAGNLEYQISRLPLDRQDTLTIKRLRAWAKKVAATDDLTSRN